LPPSDPSSYDAQLSAFNVLSNWLHAPLSIVLKKMASIRFRELPREPIGSRGAALSTAFLALAQLLLLAEVGSAAHRSKEVEQ
jgi:hypothetical protein